LSTHDCPLQGFWGGCVSEEVEQKIKRFPHRFYRRDFKGGEPVKLKKWVCVLLAVFLLAGLFCMPALAAADDVADAVEQTWGDASEQIKTVVDSVVFPALGMVLAIAFFVKLAMAYFDYRKHGQFEWTGPAILFVCLIFVLLAPNYIWGIVGL
jgi:hypothetical protein